MGKWKELAEPLDDSDAPIAMPTDANLLQQALDVMLAAIKAGDWKVDGACDPDMVIYLIQHRLSQLNDIHTCHDQCQKTACVAARKAAAGKDRTMKPVAWIKIRELSYMKAVAEHGKDDWQTNLGLKPEPDDEGLYTETQVQRMIELLERCENEMRYAGWTKFESDNPARNGVYEDVKEFLK